MTNRICPNCLGTLPVEHATFCSPGCGEVFAENFDAVPRDNPLREETQRTITSVARIREAIDSGEIRLGVDAVENAELIQSWLAWRERNIQQRRAVKEEDGVFPSDVDYLGNLILIVIAHHENHEVSAWDRAATLILGFPSSEEARAIYPTAKQIAEQVKLSTRSVSGKLRYLINKKLASVVSRNPNTYTLGPLARTILLEFDRWQKMTQ